MKRILFIMMMCLPMVVMAQENATPKKVAVYVTSDDEKIDNTTKSIIGGELVNAIVKTRKYQAVERTADFLKQITKEQGYQRSGNVDDGQISALGKQFGVHYVCVANVLPLRDNVNIYIQTRLIDVETATVMAFAREVTSISDISQMMAASEKVAFALIGAGGSSPSYSNPSQGYRSSPGQGNVIELEANGVRFKMIKVEGGTFRMGSYSGDSDEQPVHSVTLSDYYIGETEVTQALWSAVMGTTVRQQRDKADVSYSIYGEGDNYPIYYVSWNECMEFVSRLSQITGRRFALPTEAQWEYAARGGNKSRAYTYSGSNNIFDVAWHTDNSSNTHPVGTKMANELGIYDMSGNVREWCSDWYGTYSSSLQTDPAGPSTGSNRVRRGGGWDGNASGCRSTFRHCNSPDSRDYYLGLRLVLLF